MSMSFSASIKLNKVDELLAHGRWFSMVNPVSSTSETTENIIQITQVHFGTMLH